MLALQGQSVVECAYVESHLTDLPFFASQVRLGRNGVEVRPHWNIVSTRTHLIHSNSWPDLPFSASKVRLGCAGHKLSPVQECHLLEPPNFHLTLPRSEVQLL